MSFRLLIIIFSIILGGMLQVTSAQAEKDCDDGTFSNLDSAVAPILEVLSKENSKLFGILGKVIEDINTYSQIYNEENDQYYMAFTFSILKSFADLEEQEITSNEIITLLEIVRDEYDIEIPEESLNIIGQIGRIRTIQNKDGSSSIKILSSTGKNINVNIESMIEEDDGEEQEFKIKRLIIKNGAEIKFSELGVAKDTKRKIDSFFQRSTITSKKDLISKKDATKAKKFVAKKKHAINPISIGFSGLTVKFDIKGEDIDSADLRGGVVLPELKDGTGKPMPNFYIGLKNISYGLFSLDAELPL